MNRIKMLWCVLAWCSAVWVSGQGSLALLGGGGEDWGGWSDEPFSFIVEHAVNKKVAVISYVGNQTEWIPNYFKDQGAVAADNIHIGSRVVADQQSMYDSLVKYDAIYLKGGNQYRYYEYYKDTKTQEAFQAIYDRGGVLSGTSAGTAILSPIAYTAELVSADPGQTLLNPYSTQITLEDDFLTTQPERLIYDTHFAERGRFGRLNAFMASWYKDRGEVAIGIGVDDHTALCIEPNRHATVYGQGAVSFFFSSQPDDPFDTEAGMLVSGPMEMFQLLHGCTIDLESWVVSGLENEVDPPVKEENARNTILFTGTDYPQDTIFQYFLQHTGRLTDPIAVVTGLDQTRAIQMKSSLEEAGATDVQIVQALSGSQGNSEVTDILERTGKFFFIENSYKDLMGFVNGWGNGPLLRERLTASGTVSLFIGDNARFAGKTVVEGYDRLDYPSYHGQLEFRDGLGLLGTTTLMPYAFVYQETYENTVTGLPYAMVKDSAAFGLYVAGNTMGEYSYDNENNSHFRYVSGSYPLILLQNEGTFTGFANQGPDATSRNVAGFASMNLRFLGEGDRVLVGTNVPAGTGEPGSLHDTQPVYPNPATDRIYIGGTVLKPIVSLTDLRGMEIFRGSTENGRQLHIGALPAGMYIVRILDPHTGETVSATRLIKVPNP